LPPAKAAGFALLARRPEMRKALLFSAVAAIGFFVTVETPVRPEAGFQTDFEPAAHVEILAELVAFFEWVSRDAS
jgi:hypothetical protein